MNSLVNTYSKQIGFFMVAAAIILFMPFVQTVMISGFIAMFESEKISFIGYLEVIGVSFAYGYLCSQNNPIFSLILDPRNIDKS